MQNNPTIEAFQTVPSDSRSEWIAVAVSLGFWLSLGTSAILTLLLVLAPRLIENVHLQDRLLKNAAVLIELHHETQHLAMMEQALRTDSDFVSRLAAEELHSVLPAPDTVQIPQELQFDAREFENTPRQLQSPTLLCMPLFELLATPGKTRNRCALLAAGLVLLAFGCFHEGLTDGSLALLRGRLLDRALHRYRGQTSN